MVHVLKHSAKRVHSDHSGPSGSPKVHLGRFWHQSKARMGLPIGHQ